MKAALRKAFFLIATLLFLGGEAKANGCTGSWFTMTYSPWCNCWQVCGNYISDCDEVVSLSWNFGDGTTATGENPCHQFPGPGTYTITLTIVAYCHNTFFNLFTTTCHITQQLTVPANNLPLVAGFESDTTCFGTGTQFTNTTTSPGGNNTYTWVFPDGTISHDVNPVYTFDSCGAFDVKMIVQNQSPCCQYLGDDTIVKRVFVDCTPFAHSNGLGQTEPYIQESFATIDVLSGTCAGDTTHFLLTPSGPIINWQWTFPDSSTSTATNPAYVYYSCPPAINYTTVNLWTDQGCVGYIDSVTGIFCPSNIGLSSTQTLCTNQCSGTATTTLSGGQPPYTLQWNDPNNQTTATAINLCPGNYNVTITDGNGCTATPNQPVAVTDFPFPLAANATIVSNVPCYGWDGGSALLTYTGGTPPYTVFWSNGATTDTASGLHGGNYTATVTDAHGCTLVAPVNIPQPPEVLAPVTVNNASCNLCNGSASVSPTGGNGSYIYQWLTTPTQITPSVSGLCAGVYTVMVFDQAVWGCGDTVTFTVSEIGAQPITSSSTDATCVNTCNGTGSVTLTGGCLDPPCGFSWLDSTGASLGQFAATATNLCAGDYIVNVTNGSGCRSFSNTTVNVPNPVTVTATATINTCGSACNATGTASVSGGTPPYTYAWLDSNNVVVAGQTSNVITGLCTGRYTVRVTDGQGCIATFTVPVFGNPFTATATGNSVLCNGDCSGIVTTIGAGGTTPYNYTVQNSGGSVVYTGNSFITANLCAGNYTVIATDAANCPITIPVSVGQPVAINPITSATAPACFGNCNGTVLVNVTGGTAPYSYEWRNGQGVLVGNGSSVPNLCAGVYSVQVKDSNSCTTPFIPATLNQPAALNDSLHVIDPYCDGGQGSIDLTPFGGTPPYTFSWNSGAYTTEDISGLSSGTFNVQITDANNCVKNDAVTFTMLPLLTVNVIPHSYNGYNFKCFNGVDGEVVVRVNGGQPPYTYQWDDSLRSTVDSIYGLSPGVYHVTVTDANGCVRVDSANMTLVPPPYSLSEVHQNSLCAGSNSGSINVTPVGGVPPYLAYWEHDNNLNSTQISNLSTGRYVVYVFDSVFCLRIDTININEPPPLTASHTMVPALCPGINNGSVDLTVTGGTVPYSFSWNNGAYTTEDISGLANGTYIALITDSNNCTISDTALLPVIPPLVTTLTPHSYNGYQFKCFNGNDGAIKLTATGGTPPYTYLWDDSGASTTDSIDGLAPGLYHVTVTDANGCVKTDSANLNLVPPPYSLSNTYQNSLCADNNTGTITIIPAGGVPPYTTTWQHDNTLNNTQISNLDTGTYIVFVTDSVFCQLSDTVHISQPPAITLSFAPVNVTCAGGADGSVDLTAAGGVNPIQFSWNAGTYTTEDIAVLTAGNYTVVVTDSNSCSVSGTVTVSEPPAIIATTTTSNVTCFNGADGAIDLTLTNAIAPVIYNWNTGQFATEDLQNLPAGTYAVLATDNNSCTATATATITEPPFITGSRQVSICATDSLFAGGAYQNTAGVYQDTLTTAAGCDSLLTTTLSLINTTVTQFNQTLCYGQAYFYNGNYYPASGIYTDTLTATTGCDSVVSFTLNILPDIDLVASPSSAKLPIGDSITVNILSNAAAGNITYTWFPTNGLSCTDCSMSIVSPEGDTRYQITGTDAYGCHDTTFVSILLNPPVLFIPNVFTPNGDGANDFFEVFGNLPSLRYMEVKVFDRWGEKVFESNDHNFKWDGTFKGKPMQPAVFVYVINAAFVNESESRIWKGSVTLMR